MAKQDRNPRKVKKGGKKMEYVKSERKDMKLIVRITVGCAVIIKAPMRYCCTEKREKFKPEPAALRALVKEMIVWL